MTREEKLAAVREVLRGESFAVFAFAGAPGEPPYTSVMFFAETDDLEILFATSPGSFKVSYTRDGNGACAQFDTRGVGLENFAKFARVTLQGRIERLATPETTAEAHAIYLKKLPFAKPFLRPGVLTFRLHPTRVVCARGFQERIELEFPAPQS
jgi:nitroimidazol reductase NimA-like FMN-containing flavoprotein (pyridoxamine 5'-phosphate oxidase superfamily)